MLIQPIRRGLLDSRIDPKQERRRRNLLRRNLLTKTELFSDAIWTGYYIKPALVSGQMAPDGTSTAWRWDTSLTVGGPDSKFGGLIQEGLVSEVGKIITASVWIRADTACTMNFGVGDNGTLGFSVTTAWQRISRTYAVGADRRYWQLFDSVSTVDTNVYLWHPQAEYGTVTTAYQRVVSENEFY